MRYEAIPAKHYRNVVTKEVASVFGDLPFHSETDETDWVMESAGWTIRDNLTDTVGFGLNHPFSERAEALRVAGELESAAAAGMLRHWLPRSFPSNGFTISLNTGNPTGVMVLWKHAVQPSLVEDIITTVLESARLEMAVTGFSTDGVYARFHIVPNGAPYRGSEDEPAGAEAA